MLRLFFTQINQRNEWIFAAQIFLSTCFLFSVGVLLDILNLTMVAVLGVVCATLAQLQSQYICGTRSQRNITLACFTIAMVLSALCFYTSSVLLILYFSLCTLVMVFLSSALGGRFTGLGFTTILASIYMIWGMRVLHQPIFLGVAFLLGACTFYVVNRFWAQFNAQQSQHAALAQCYLHFAQLFEDLTKRLEGSDKEQYMLLQQQCQTYAQLSTKFQQAKLLITPIQDGTNAQQTTYASVYAHTQALQELTFCLMSKTAFETCQQHPDLSIAQLKDLSVQCRSIAKRLKNPASVGPSIKTFVYDTTTPLPCIQSCIAKLSTIEDLLFNDASKTNISINTALNLEVRENPWLRIRSGLSWHSNSMRYAMRLSLGFSLCFCIALSSPWPNHEWLLITFWMVCRPSYGATRQRLLERTAGTFFGLAFSVPLITLFSGVLYLEIAALIVCLTLFFILIEISYTKAVFFITLFVIFAYNLINNQALEIVMPRMLYTLLGIGVAGFVTFFLWPQWRKNLIPEQLQTCLTSNRKYLKQCLKSERDKEKTMMYFQRTLKNHLQLVTYWHDMQQEPARKRGSMQHLFNLIQLNLECIIAIRALVFMKTTHLPQVYESINMLFKDNGSEDYLELPEQYLHLAHLVKKLSSQQYDTQKQLSWNTPHA